MTRKPSSTPIIDERIEAVRLAHGYVTFRLVDGRVISIPVSWIPRLGQATPEEREDFEITSDGSSVRWPAVGTEITGQDLLRSTQTPQASGRSPARSPVFRRNWTPEAIEKLRERLSLNQTQFADQMGVRQATISDWESGRHKHSSLACRLLDLLYRNSLATRR